MKKLKYSLPDIIPYRRDNKWGFCDKNFKIIIPIIYDDVHPFSEDLAAVKIGKFWGFINNKGLLVIEPSYQSVFDFQNNTATVLRPKSNNYLEIDKQGKVISTSYPRQVRKTEDLYIKSVEIKRGGDYRWMYFYEDGNGKKVLPKFEHSYYNLASLFINGIALVDSNAFINKNGENVFNVKFKKAELFSEDYSAVVFDSKYESKKTQTQQKLNTDIKKQKISRDYCGFISKTGVSIVCKDFEKVKGFNEGYAPVKNKNKWVFIDKTFKIAFNSKIKLSEYIDSFLDNDIQYGFDYVGRYSEDLAAINLMGKWGFIDKEGKPVIKCKFDSAGIFHNGLARVSYKISKSELNNKTSDSFLYSFENRQFHFFIDQKGNEYFETIMLPAYCVQKNDPKSENSGKKYNQSELVKRISKMLLEQPIYIIKFLSNNYPFTEIELDNLKDNLDWRSVSKNTNIDFNSSLILRFKSKWFWSELSQNKKILWDLSLLKELISYLYCPQHILGNPISKLSSSSNLEWDLNVIDEFKEKWDWDKLSRNPCLPYNTSFINSFKFFWNWKILCARGNFWTEDLIKSLENELDHEEERWNYLISNSFIPWSKIFIEKYKDKWFNKIPFRTCSENDLYNNSSLPWDENLIEILRVKLNWFVLSASEILPWSLKLIQRFSNEWDWERLSENTSIPWDGKLIKLLETQIVQKPEFENRLFYNQTVRWTEKLIDKYNDSIDWKILSQNQNICWSIEIICKYEEKLDWVNLSSNPSIPWNKSLIDKFSNKVNFFSLSRNKNLKWDYDLILNYKDKIDWYGFSSSNQNWSKKIINDFNNYFDWSQLLLNKTFPWSFDLVKKYHSKMLISSPLSEDDFMSNKYDILLLNPITKDSEYFDWLIKTYPEINSESYKFITLNIEKIDKVFLTELNEILINMVKRTKQENNYLPTFPNEDMVAQRKFEYQLEEAELKENENRMSNNELAQLLGYDGDDIDDISADDIWERTGH